MRIIITTGTYENVPVVIQNLFLQFKDTLSGRNF